MKTKTYSIFYAAFILACILFFGCRPNDVNCPSPNAKVYLQYSNQFVPYQGNEQLKFLHNNTDTQIFIGQGKTSYFINDNTASDMGCSKDHESTKINFINNTSKILSYLNMNLTMHYFHLHHLGIITHFINSVTKGKFLIYNLQNQIQRTSL